MADLARDTLVPLLQHGIVPASSILRSERATGDRRTPPYPACRPFWGPVSSLVAVDDVAVHAAPALRKDFSNGMQRGRSGVLEQLDEALGRHAALPICVKPTAAPEEGSQSANTTAEHLGSTDRWSSPLTG